MSNFDINKVINNLKKEKDVFINEVDFQVNLALTIKKTYQNANIQFESKEIINSKERIDIIIDLLGECVAIELKYVPKESIIQSLKNNFIYNLHQHHNTWVCFDYLHDVYRLENLVKSTNHKITSAYAIMITSQEIFWKGPKSNVNYYNFRLTDGRNIDQNNSLNFQRKTKSVKNKYNSSIVFQNSYTLEWKDYSNLIDTKSSEIEYKILCIGIK